MLFIYNSTLTDLYHLQKSSKSVSSSRPLNVFFFSIRKSNTNWRQPHLFVYHKTATKIFFFAAKQKQLYRNGLGAFDQLFAFSITKQY